jgi:CRP/FNR family transcriptional regulator, cyclic AMP receptor protein
MQVTRSPVIQALSAAERGALLERAVPRRLAAGERLLLAGDDSGRTHVLCRGLLKLVASDGRGRESILCLAVPGELVGEISAVDGRRQPLDAVAATRSEAVSLDTGLLQDALARSPAAALALARLLARRSRWICDAALERATGDVAARLAGRLLDLAALLGTVEDGVIDVELPLPQEDLGRLAGMCRESTCKTLRRFKAAGVLDYRRRRLRIMRPDALEEVKSTGRLTRLTCVPPPGPRRPKGSGERQ